MQKFIVFLIASMFYTPCFADSIKINYKAASAIQDELGKPLARVGRNNQRALRRMFSQ